MTVDIFLSRPVRLSYALTLFLEIVCPLFEAAKLLDLLKTTLIEPADETLEALNVFPRLVERPHL